MQIDGATKMLTHLEHLSSCTVVVHVAFIQQRAHLPMEARQYQRLLLGFHCLCLCFCPCFCLCCGRFS